MSDLTPVLQEMAERSDAAEMLMPHEIREAGERRRRRLVVATATCAVVAAVAAGLVVSLSTRNTASVGPVGHPNPAPTSSTNPDDRVGIIGPPPPGTLPTGPATGEIVAGATLYDSGTWVYADGRIINVLRHVTSDQYKGYVVRQLTPSGVEAMRSFLLDGTSRLKPVDKVDGELVVRNGGRLMFARDFSSCDATFDGGSCPAFT